MKDTIIVSGGNIQKDFALDFLKKNRTEHTCIIAADRGVEFFMGTDLKPDIAVGDFDSLSKEGEAYMETLINTEILRLKPEKDDSDTQSAVNYAIEHGAGKIMILGATGNRIDHLMANFGLLMLGKLKDVQIILADKYNYMCLIENGTILKNEEQFGKYVSFFPIGGEVCNLTLKGFKYPLDGYCLRTEDSGLTVSNEFREANAEVTFDSGTLLMIMSRD